MDRLAAGQFENGGEAVIEGIDTAIFRRDCNPVGDIAKDPLKQGVLQLQLPIAAVEPQSGCAKFAERLDKLGDLVIGRDFKIQFRAAVAVRQSHHGVRNGLDIGGDIARYQKGRRKGDADTQQAAEQVLLLDEPLSNLDAKLRRHVREQIRKIQQELQLTAVYVTHDQEEAMAVSDRIIVMKNAEIAQEGTPYDLYERPNSAFIADFIGDSNLVECDIISASSEGTEIRLGKQQLMLPLQTDLKGRAQAVLRPHHINLHPATENDALVGEVTYAAYLGNEMQYTVEGAFGELFVIAQSIGQPIKMGQSVGIGMSIEDLRLVPID